jgi:hypothetical protein
VPRFIVKDTEGETLGVHDFATGEWTPGDRIPMPPGPTLVVEKVLDGREDELPVLFVTRSE